MKERYRAREPAMSEVARAQPEITPERWHQIRDLLAELIGVPAEDGPKYLAEVCGADFDLRSEGDSLLAAHEIAEGGVLEKPIFGISTADISDSQTPDRLAGRQIGAYRLEGEIARGGMGTVWRAARADDRFHKKVAIKILDVGRLSTLSLELFRTERAIFANLEHPNISRFLDVGET